MLACCMLDQLKAAWQHVGVRSSYCVGIACRLLRNPHTIHIIVWCTRVAHFSNRVAHLCRMTVMDGEVEYRSEDAQERPQRLQYRLSEGLSPGFYLRNGSNILRSSRMELRILRALTRNLTIQSAFLAIALVIFLMTPEIYAVRPKLAWQHNSVKALVP